LCESCRLTRVIPDLSQSQQIALWYRLEAAKRRLIYSLMRLGLPLVGKHEDSHNGLVFEFRADTPLASPPVLTGHNNGVITLNVAEADDVERTKRRQELNEPYRTLLGHFRHESGHYYWDRLIKDSERIDEFRQLFGDEREDYGAAVQRHYQKGAPADWHKRFVSAYASMHAWEDWAETWAHYLHMVDTQETAISCGVSLHPPRADEPALTPEPTLADSRSRSFEQILHAWFPLTYLINNLNRGLGMPDAYPFVLPPPAIDKLRFVHDTVAFCEGCS
jgi:hypothetical protein